MRLKSGGSNSSSGLIESEMLLQGIRDGENLAKDTCGYGPTGCEINKNKKERVFNKFYI